MGADLALAVVFLTRLPLPGRWAAAGRPARAAAFYPLAGMVAGGAAAAVLWLAAAAGLPPLAGALAAVATGAVLTGALHEDGLADLADGLGVTDRETRLAVMRDSRSGSFGVLALVLSVGLRAALLTGPDPATAAAALVAAHALARAPLASLMRWLPPARSDGLAAGSGRPAVAAAGAAGLLGAAVAGLVLPPGRALAAILAVLATALLAAGLLRRWLGGVTGDGLGAAEQAGEIMVLAVLAAAAA